MKALIFGVAIAAVLALFYFIGRTSASNSEIRLRNSVKSQEQVREAVYDKVWKIIQQQAGVTGEYEKSFRKVYGDIMTARYDKGGALMKFVQESNPKFDSSLFKDLNRTIEAQREDFLNAQKRLIDISQEHNNLIQTFPGSFFIGDRELTAVKVISSAKSKQVMETGEENDVDVFPKDTSK